ncbi:MAG: CDP-2,3-bis-(O-geranylgeranyl)-sn-glycerol synthase [Methanobacteriota archaeon]|nr:MAG: CDP-2,3-bis-(O-geranylgeranyl)-sn-glycerol synthase [Euryarchaeota archaeon]
MLPAYVPNPIAVVCGGGRPIDLGRSLSSDGRRIFGDGKTIRGFLCGVAAGIAVGMVQVYAGPASGLDVPAHTFMTVTLLATGALLGDLAKSFIKRRIGKERGDQWLIADQYDLVVGAGLLLLVFAPEWLFANVTWQVAIAIIVITPLLHRVVNIIGYVLKVKDVPW